MRLIKDTPVQCNTKFGNDQTFFETVCVLAALIGKHGRYSKRLVGQDVSSRYILFPRNLTTFPINPNDSFTPVNIAQSS